MQFASMPPNTPSSFLYMKYYFLNASGMTGNDLSNPHHGNRARTTDKP